jgi:hypothetical protein
MTRLAGHTASCPKGVNESRGKQRILRTIMPAFELSEERKKEGVVMPSSRMCHCDQPAK